MEQTMSFGVEEWEHIWSPPTNFHGRRIYEQNAKVVNALLGGLKEHEFIKVMHYKFQKEIWDKLQNVISRRP